MLHGLLQSFKAFGSFADELLIGKTFADDYVNVRSESNTDSEIVGKLYRGCAATILENNIKEEDGEWTKIESGNVKGYIKKEYLAIGFDVDELVDKFGTKYATVNTTTLNVRTKTSTDATILTQIPVGESYEVVKEYAKWVKISLDDGDIEGFVAKEYVDISVKFQKAVSIEEEKAEQEREEAARRAQEEQERKLKEQQEAAAEASKKEEKKESSTKTESTQSESKKETTSQETTSEESTSEESTSQETTASGSTGSD
ncbi:SH3 domain-containing protein, partial [uncultured Ruminobacter sp.]|uniref:SH3 domain-containing protein n=1 Tax=uncultured Ruminobacter sp. TaxID=538947 RepID=UPI00345977CC